MTARRRGVAAMLAFGQLVVVLAAALVVTHRAQPSTLSVAALPASVVADDRTPHTYERVVTRVRHGSPAPGSATLSTTAAPAWVEIPRFGVRARVLPMGVAADGAMDTPDNPSLVGWYVGGAKPGDPRGSTVLDGHVDSAATGPGAFYDIVRLEPGDTVVVGGPAGTVRYAVTGVTERRKSLQPAPDVFDLAGPARLVLITCGGAFNAAVGHYVDNIVVFARPVDAVSPR